MYAARLGDVFGDPQRSTVGEPPPAQSGGTPPAAPAIGSAEQRTPDQAKPSARVRHSARVVAVSAAALRRAARTGRLTVPVQVAGGGTVTVRATAMLGGTRRTVGTGTVRVRGAARRQVTIRLSRAARTQLRRKRSLTLRLEAFIPQKTDPRRTSVTVRFQTRGTRG